MNGRKQSFEARGFHPALSGEWVGGKIFPDRWNLGFQSDQIVFEIPLDRVAIRMADKGEGVFFLDSKQAEIKIYTFDLAILDYWTLTQSANVRSQLREVAQRGEIRRRLLLTAFVFLACVLLAWLGAMAAGNVVRIAADRIPLSWDEGEGDALMQKLKVELSFIDDPRVEEHLTAFAEPLTRAVPVKGVHFKFHVLSDSDPNAFALPGGNIIVTTGMLELAGPPDELLGVLAHEMAHITQRHALRHAISGRSPVYMVKILTGGRNGALEALAFPTELLAYESFSQEYEREADSVGWNYLLAANINPHGMIEIFRKMEEREVGLDHGRGHAAFHSHPALGKRIGWLESLWQKIPDKSGFTTLTNPVPKVEDSTAIPLRL